MEEQNQKANYDVASVSGKVVKIHNIISNTHKIAETGKPFINIFANKLGKFKANNTVRTYG